MRRKKIVQLIKLKLKMGILTWSSSKRFLMIQKAISIVVPSSSSPSNSFNNSVRVHASNSQPKNIISRYRNPVSVKAFFATNFSIMHNFCLYLHYQAYIWDRLGHICSKIAPTQIFAGSPIFSSKRRGTLRYLSPEPHDKLTSFRLLWTEKTVNSGADFWQPEVRFLICF